ncbi:MAG: hypothetical protein RMN52_11375 [Anaerolineae bacterium]|nr:hypothetical protein [Candidatus Roseilinea sp.]MDW8450592.1 hypothetical protein [Anaerolineae bacterium]
MKLGILVVYLFSAQTKPLLDLHLSRIERYTQVPYTIYASASRLAPEFREYLALHPRIRICDIPYTDLRDSEEHSYYLDHLARIAIEDGVTHGVTLHLDSFPIRHGWAEELAGRLSNQCVLATIDSVNTACLFFHRDFYCRCHPHFLVTEEERKSALYRKFLVEHNPHRHSGTGYAYRAYQCGLSWNYLQLTPAYSADQIGDVFDGMIFHLRHAIWVGDQHPKQMDSLHSHHIRMIAAASCAYKRFVPVNVRREIRWRFARVLQRFVDKPLQMQHAQRIKQFLQDPEAYIAPIERRVALGS